MCGICGIIGSVKGSDVLLSAMAETLRHRGPDHTGYLNDQPVSLAMTRLSIIDLEGGFQPMHSADGNVSLIFNGEIYNFRELRKEIESEISFKTRSDTEVILNGYSLWGKDIFKRLNGIFAIALWDRRARKVFLVRDPMGIKPYYYLAKENRIYFSSEIKTFTLLGLANTAQHQAITQFLCADYVFHPDSAISGVVQVAPGAILEVDQDERTAEEHIFRAPGDYAPKELPADDQEKKKAIKQLLEESVIRQTVADVPYGLLLSSGLDSMSVLALLHRHNLTENLRTYTVYYPGNDSFSENEPVTRLAERWGFNNELIPLTAKDLREHWERICLTFDNLDMLPTAVAIYFASQVAGKERRVLLAGNGGDELLFGYPTYQATKWVRKTKGFAPLFKRILPALARWLPASDDYLTLSEKIRRFSNGYDSNPALAHVKWRHIFTSSELKGLLHPEYWMKTEEEMYKNQLVHFDEGRSRGFNGASLDAWADLRTWMVDSGLMMWDKAGMAGSTEIRVPMLDLDFVDNVLALPEEVRSGGAVGTKGLLKEIVADEVPEDILSLPKHGFQLPIASWLRGDLRDMFHDLTDSLPDRVFKRDEIQRLWSEFEQSKGDHSLKLWTLGALAGWSKAHDVVW